MNYLATFRFCAKSVLLLLCLALCLTQSISASELMRERTFELLEDARSFYEDGNLVRAIEIIDKLAGYKNNPYEYAVIFQNKGYFHLELNQEAETIAAFERALSYDALSPEIAQQLRYNLVQLHYSAETWEDCLRVLEQWLPGAESPGPDVFVVGAVANIGLKNYSRAIQYIQQAIKRSEDPQKSHYDVWLACLFEQSAQTEAEQLLETIIELFPMDLVYWQQLTAVRLEKQQDKPALATLELARKQGLLKGGEDYSLLFSLYVTNGLPYQAATVMRDALEVGSLPRNFENLEKLSKAWQLANEIELAIEALEQAAEKKADGATEFRIARLYLEAENWDKTVYYLKSAISKGNFNNLEQAEFLLGYAHIQSGAVEAGIEKLRIIDEKSKYYQQSVDWINYAKELFQKDLGN